MNRSPARYQRGFVDKILMVLGALLVLGLAGRFAWWVATEENFGEVFTVLWAIAFVAAYWLTDDDFFVARMPAGLLVFAVLGLAGLPLTWLGQSRVALIVLLPVQIAFSVAAGGVLSRRARSRASSGAPGEGEPALPEQRRDVIAGLGAWGLLALGAVMFLWVAPLLALAVVSVVTDVPSGDAKWICAAWGLAAVTWFAVRGGAARWLWLPVGAWIYLAVTAIAFAADLLAGPFAEKSGLQVAYIVLPGALIAAFVEVFVPGGGGLKGPGRNSNKEET